MLDLSNLSTIDINGTGALDVLLQTCQLHISKEYKEQRITSEKYAEVYIAMLNSCLSAATNIYIATLQLDAQKEINDQRLITELAQTQEGVFAKDVDGNLILDAEGNPTYEYKFDGLIQSQKNVHVAQSESLLNEVLLRLGKQYFDVFSVMYTQNNELNVPNTVTHTNVSNISKEVVERILGAGFITRDSAP